MIYIYKDRIIRLEWTILKGTSNVKENFDRALVKLFLIGPADKYLLDATAENGVITANIPQGLPEGNYSVEVIYSKNWGNLRRGKSVDVPPTPINPDFEKKPIDDRFNDRCLMRSRKDDLFGITNYESEADNVGEGEVVLALKSSVSSFGYDGLSIYELSVMRGFVGSESYFLEWAHEGILANVNSLLQELKNRDTRFVVKDIAGRDKLFADGEVQAGEEVFVLNEMRGYVLNESGEFELSKSETILLEEVEELEHEEDIHLLADRAIADENGRRIIDEYITYYAARIYLKQVYNQLFTENPPHIMDGYITTDMLSEGVKALLGSMGAVTNLPDDEDLTVKNGVLKLADKRWNPNQASGMGRKMLRKNMVNGVNVLTQDMMSEENTIYVIQYDFDLQGAEITVPEGCILKFEGGMISNGTLILNNSFKIEDCLNQIFKDISFLGTCNINIIRPEWFDSSSSIRNNATVAFKKAIDFSSCINNINFDDYKEKGYSVANLVLQQAIYNLTEKIEISNKGINIYGNNAILNCLHNDGEDDFVLRFVAGWSPFSLKSLIVKDLIINCNYKEIDGLIINCSGGYFENIQINNCFKRSIWVKGYENMFKHINIETKGVVEPYHYPNDYSNFIGFYLNTSDCTLDDLIVKDLPRPLDITSGNNNISNVHVWGTNKGVLPRYAIFLNSNTGCKITNVTADTINRADDNKDIDELVNGCYNGGAAIIFYNATQNIINNVYVMAAPNVFVNTGLTKHQDYVAWFNEWGRGNTIISSFLHTTCNPGSYAFAGYYYQNFLMDIKTEKQFGNTFTQYGPFLNVEISEINSIKDKVVGDEIDNFSIYMCDNHILTRKKKQILGLESLYSKSGAENEIPNPFNIAPYGEQFYYAWDTHSFYIKHDNKKYTVLEGVISGYKDGSIKPLIHKGTTLERPDSTYLYIGYYYFDESLNKPIWYNGDNKWIDATGAEV